MVWAKSGKWTCPIHIHNPNRFISSCVQNHASFSGEGLAESGFVENSGRRNREYVKSVCLILGRRFLSVCGQPAQPAPFHVLESQKLFPDIVWYTWNIYTDSPVLPRSLFLLYKACVATREGCSPFFNVWIFMPKVHCPRSYFIMRWVTPCSRQCPLYGGQLFSSAQQHIYTKSLYREWIFLEGFTLLLE